MKKILFPTDLSDAANHAFIYALQLADKWQASITTLHVYQELQVGDVHLPGSLYNFYETMDLYSFQNYKDSIPALVDLAEKNEMGHIELRHMLEEGEVVKSILEAADAEGADMIVLGTTGARGLKEIFLGSVAGEILENATCPVLAVPAKAEFDGTIDNIAYATTYQAADVTALRKLVTLFENFNPNFHCISVDLAHTATWTRRMEEFKETVGETTLPIHYEVIDSTEMHKGITDYLADKQIDIITMLTHKRNFIQELFSYSKTKSLAYHASTPVLALHA